MKKPALWLFFLLLLHTAKAQQEPVRLIIRADDMGSSHSVNRAIMQSCREGIATSVEIMAPCPWFPEAVRLLKENPAIDAGIHLTLTSEWENLKWRPLTRGKSLADNRGFFYPMVYPNPNYPGQSVSEKKPVIAEIEEEFRAQIEMVLKEIPGISHLTAHMGCTGYSTEIELLTQALAKEYKLLYEPGNDRVKPVSYEGPHGTSTEKIQSFIRMLESLKPEGTYLFVDHPGINDPELQAISHIGYEDVSSDRQGVTDVYLDRKVKSVIQQKGIHLIGYSGLDK